MKKISNEKVAQVLHDASNALRAMAAERDAALLKLSSVQRRQEAEKLASTMHNKGLHLDVQFNDLSDSLEKAAEQGRLPIIQEAVGMMGNNMNFVQLNNDEMRTGGTASDFERFVMGDVG
jgi:hypothetical protein